MLGAIYEQQKSNQAASPRNNAQRLFSDSQADIECQLLSRQQNGDTFAHDLACDDPDKLAEMLFKLPLTQRLTVLQAATRNGNLVWEDFIHFERVAFLNFLGGLSPKDRQAVYSLRDSSGFTLRFILDH